MWVSVYRIVLHPHGTTLENGLCCCCVSPRPPSASSRRYLVSDEFAYRPCSPVPNWYSRPGRGYHIEPQDVVPYSTVQYGTVQYYWRTMVPTARLQLPLLPRPAHLCPSLPTSSSPGRSSGGHWPWLPGPDASSGSFGLFPGFRPGATVGAWHRLRSSLVGGVSLSVSLSLVLLGVVG